MSGSDDSKKSFYRPKDLVEMGYGSRPTIYRKLDNGTIPSVRIGKSYLVPKDEFDMLLMKERLQRESEQVEWRTANAVREIVKIAGKLTPEQRETVLAALA